MTHWQDEATTWLRSLFPDSGAFEVAVIRERSWSTIWTLTVDDGVFWFKTGHPALHREAALRHVLERHASHDVLPLMAVHPTHGWMVTQDQGPTLAGLGPDGAPTHLVALAAAAARVQRAVPLSELESLDLAVFRPEEAVGTLDSALAWFAALPTSHPAHVDARLREEALAAMNRQVRRWEQVDPGFPLSVDHNDLHLGNAFLGPRISDWGDSVIGHPFSSMRTLSFAAAASSLDVAAVEDAYLRTWGSPDELREALHVAAHLAVSQRLHVWYQLDDVDLCAEYSRWFTPLFHEIGCPITMP